MEDNRIYCLKTWQDVFEEVLFLIGGVSCIVTLDFQSRKLEKMTLIFAKKWQLFGYH